MLTFGAYEKCKKYIEQHSEDSQKTVRRKTYPAICISRETGAGANTICELLTDFLQQKTKEPHEPWTYFNKQLIEKVLVDSNLPRRLTNYVPEDKYSHISDVVVDLLGVRPSEWTILQRTTKTILKIAESGKAIIVGRGSTVITSNLPNVIQIRLIAPLEMRVQHLITQHKLDRKYAVDFIRREDRARKKYVKTHFFKDIDDLAQYHIVINTEKVMHNEASELIGELVIKKFPECFN